MEATAHVLKPPKWGYWKALEGHTVTARLIDHPFLASDRVYEIALDGKPIGLVEKTKRTWDRRPRRGARYVTARGEVTAWRCLDLDGHTKHHRVKWDTRVEAAYRMAERHLEGQR